MKPCELPVRIFNELHAIWRPDGHIERYGIEGSLDEAQVFRAVVPGIPAAECWLSLEEHGSGRFASSVLRMWPRRPDAEHGGIAQRSVLVIRGGPRMTGFWAKGKGNEYVGDLIVRFDRGADGSLCDKAHAGRLAAMIEVLRRVDGILGKEPVERESFHDGLGADA